MNKFREVQFSMSDYFSFEGYQLTFIRLWMVAVGIFTPIYGVVLLHANSNAIDYVSHRLGFSFIYFILIVGSFFIPFFKKYIVPLSYTANIFTWTWIVWIVVVNNFSMDYSLGLVVSLGCIGIVYRNWKEMMAFYVFISLVIFVAYSVTPQPECDALHLGTIMIITVFVQLLVVTKRDLLNQNLREKHQELVEKNKELQQFVYIASHDLKTPIRTISSFSSLIKKRVDNTENEELKEFSQYVEDGAKQMNTLIEDLLRYSNISHSAPQFSNFNLNNVLKSELVFLKEDEHSHNDQITLSGELPQKIIGNKNQINQLFLNLIDNGLKYNRSSKKSINITSNEDSAYWNFSIKDNGIGIEEIYVDKIFNIFGRLHGKTEFEGTGIGLAICQRIIENHNGKISIQSRIGVGTTIHFSLSKKTESEQNGSYAPVSTVIFSLLWCNVTFFLLDYSDSSISAKRASSLT